VWRVRRLADANESRDWRIYADFAQTLIATARRLYARDPMGVDLDQSLNALDSTTIDLCLALFPWARFRHRKAAVKMHTLLDLRGNIPAFVHITDGKVHDVNVLDQIVPEAGAFYVVDRGYIDFERLLALTLSAAFLVVRTKSKNLAPAPLLASGGQEDGCALGSDGGPVVVRVGLGLSRSAAEGELLRCRIRQASHQGSPELQLEHAPHQYPSGPRQCEFPSAGLRATGITSEEESCGGR
jgi:hypothetical protein